MGRDVVEQPQIRRVAAVLPRGPRVLRSADPETPLDLRLKALAFHRLGFTRMVSRGDMQAADDYRRSIALYEGLLAEKPGDNELRVGLAETYNDLGVLLVYPPAASARGSPGCGVRSRSRKSKRRKHMSRKCSTGWPGIASNSRPGWKSTRNRPRPSASGGRPRSLRAPDRPGLGRTPGRTWAATVYSGAGRGPGAVQEAPGAGRSPPPGSHVRSRSLRTGLGPCESPCLPDGLRPRPPGRSRSRWRRRRSRGCRRALNTGGCSPWPTSTPMTRSRPPKRRAVHELRPPQGQVSDWLLMAMISYAQDRRDEARNWYDRALRDRPQG